MIRKPLLLVIDDLFGRVVDRDSNPDREKFLNRFDGIAEFEFFRGQQPVDAKQGDTVENDVQGTLDFVRRFWSDNDRAACVLLDLCFYTGEVTSDSEIEKPGMPVGRDADDKKHGYFGLKLLKHLHREFPELPVIILSGMKREEVETEFVELGGVQFLDRNAKNAFDRLQKYVNHHGLFPDLADEGMIGSSLPTLVALRTARRARESGRDLLIRGEKGTGKELMAKFIHQSNADAPFVPVNCPGLPKDIARSTIFGVRANSATGVSARNGFIQDAIGGDLFFDEIGDLDARIQSALLRFLQSREYHRVGSPNIEKAKLRVIAATELAIEEKNSGFRHSLVDRFGPESQWIRLLPLRERSGDIPKLTEFFLRLAELEYEDEYARTVSDDAMDKLLSHDWPANIRGLRGVVFGAVESFPDVGVLAADHLDLKSSTTTVPVPDVEAKSSSAPKETALAGLEREKPLLTDMLDLMERIEFPLDDTTSWLEGLSKIEQNMKSLKARMLSAAIEVGQSERSKRGKEEEDTYLPDYRMLVDRTGVLPNGTQNSNTGVGRVVKKILSNAPDSVIDENLADLKERLCPAKDDEPGSGEVP